MSFACILLASCNDYTQTRQGVFPLTILHTNDTHSHVAGLDPAGKDAFDQRKSIGGLARIAKTIKQLREKNNNVLAIDAGDLCQDSFYYSVHKWSIVTDLVNAMPWQLATLGNHEFDEGCAQLAKFLSETSIPVLAANLVPGASCPLHDSRLMCHMIVNVAGTPVGIVGIANDEVQRLSHACKDMHFLDRAQALQNEVNKLAAQGVRNIIAVTHIGLEADRRLARAVEGVAVIVGGHSHTFLGEGAKSGTYPLVEKSPSGKPVLIVTAGANTRYLGELKVNFDTRGVPLAWEGRPIFLDTDTSLDEDIARLVDEYSKQLVPPSREILGNNPLDFPDGLEQCYAGDCLSGRVMADAMLAFGRTYGAQFALLNAVGVCQPLPHGEITQADILNLHPFGDKLVLKAYSGTQIRQALEHGARNEDAEGLELIHTAGLRYFLDVTKPVGQRVQLVELFDPKGTSTPLEEDARYVAVLPDYLAAGSHRFFMLANGGEVDSPHPQTTDILGAYIRKHSPLAMPWGKRIYFVK